MQAVKPRRLHRLLHQTPTPSPTRDSYANHRLNSHRFRYWRSRCGVGKLSDVLGGAMVEAKSFERGPQLPASFKGFAILQTQIRRPVGQWQSDQGIVRAHQRASRLNIKQVIVSSLITKSGPINQRDVRPKMVIVHTESATSQPRSRGHVER